MQGSQAYLVIGAEPCDLRYFAGNGQERIEAQDRQIVSDSGNSRHGQKYLRHGINAGKSSTWGGFVAKAAAIIASPDGNHSQDFTLGLSWLTFTDAR